MKNVESCIYTTFAEIDTLLNYDACIPLAFRTNRLKPSPIGSCFEETKKVINQLLVHVEAF